MNKGSITLKYLLFCFVTLVLAYTIHTLFLKNSFCNKLLIEAYFYNFILFSLVMIIFSFLGKTHKDHLAFLYMFAMFAKLIVVYFVFKNRFRLDDNLVTKSEISSVLVPYCLSLIYSVKYIASRLNTED
jgi:hypothetical protein